MPATWGDDWLVPPNSPPFAADIPESAATMSGLILPSAEGPLALYGWSESALYHEAAPTANMPGLSPSLGCVMDPALACSSRAMRLKSRSCAHAGALPATWRMTAR